MTRICDPLGLRLQRALPFAATLTAYRCWQSRRKLLKPRGRG